MAYVLWSWTILQIKGQHWKGVYSFNLNLFHHNIESIIRYIHLYAEIYPFNCTACSELPPSPERPRQILWSLSANALSRLEMYEIGAADKLSRFCKFNIFRGMTLLWSAMITFIGYDRHHPPDVSLDNFKSSAKPHIPQTVVEKNDGESQ